MNCHVIVLTLASAVDSPYFWPVRFQAVIGVFTRCDRTDISLLRAVAAAGSWHSEISLARNPGSHNNIVCGVCMLPDFEGAIFDWSRRFACPILDLVDCFIQAFIWKDHDILFVKNLAVSKTIPSLVSLQAWTNRVVHNKLTTAAFSHSCRAQPSTLINTWIVGRSQAGLERSVSILPGSRLS